MFNKTIRRNLIGLCAWCALVGIVSESFAQWGENAPPHSANCPCVPERPWGYYQTRWHRWPGVMYVENQTPTSAGNGEIPPAQIDLPSPKNEAELKTTSPTRTPTTEAPPQTLPAETPSNPLLPKPGSAVPPSEQGTEPKNEPAMEVPRTEPPSSEGPGTVSPGTETPSNTPPSSETPSKEAPSKETPSELPLNAPESNESKPKETPSPAPNSSQSQPGSAPGAFNKSPGLKLRRFAVNEFGMCDADPAPVMPVDSAVLAAAVSEAAPAPPRAWANAKDTVHPVASNDEPELIAPSTNMKPMPAPKFDSRILPSSTGNPLPVGNPLRASGVLQTGWNAGEQKPADAVRPASDESSNVAGRANPLR
jgi:hypothetical protein